MIVPSVGGLGGGLSIAQPESAAGAAAPAEGLTKGLQGSPGIEQAGGGESVSFGSELTDAISSLESTQKGADSAAQALASGTAKDPESAVVTVEDAQMAMDLASQIRTKATEAAQSIFQTQV